MMSQKERVNVVVAPQGNIDSWGFQVMFTFKSVVSEWPLKPESKCVYFVIRERYSQISSILFKINMNRRRAGLDQVLSLPHFAYLHGIERMSTRLF